MTHHTKTRGDEGVAFVMADLTTFDLPIFQPLSEHTPYDLVVSSHDFQRLCRLSVKFRTVSNTGKVVVPLRSVWNDRHGRHVVLHDKSTYDALAIYCPDTHECYYVRLDEIPGVHVTLRVQAGRKNQQAHVRFAGDYRDPLRLFGLTSPGLVPGTPVGITAALKRPSHRPATLAPAAGARGPPAEA